MDLLIILAALVAGVLVGAIIIHLYNNNSSTGLINKATSESQRLLNTAIKESGDIVTSAENKSVIRRKEIDEEIRDRRREIGRTERRIDQREESIDRRTESIEKIEDGLRTQVTEIEAQEAEINEQTLLIQQRLEQIAGLSSDAAKEELLNQLDAELRDVGDPLLVRTLRLELAVEQIRRDSPYGPSIGAISLSAHQGSQSQCPHESLHGLVIDRLARLLQDHGDATVAITSPVVVVDSAYPRFQSGVLVTRALSLALIVERTARETGRSQQQGEGLLMP